MIHNEDILNLLSVVNAFRMAPPSPESQDLELKVEAMYRASLKLAVYGSLAPDQPNHHVLEELSGTWVEAKVQGELHPHGWGMTMGFPAFRWMPGGKDIDVWLLTSSRLPQHWKILDEFEGEAYRRILVPVETDHGMTVANIYEINPRKVDENVGRDPK
jgi:gamma-glutamylcyclotransferase (GGCT)/AIG2-like uncharacterized protein YtfP